MVDVLHLASGDVWAGAEAQVAMLAQAQVELGLRVHVATFCDGELAHRMARASIAVDVIDERQGVALAYRGLRTLLLRARPAVLHVHGYKEGLLGFASSLGLGLARVQTQHGVPEAPLDASGFKLRIYDRLNRLAGKLLRVHWIAVSEAIQVDLERAFGRRVHRIANAVSLRPPTCTSDEVRNSLRLAPAARTGPILLYAGRLEPIKGADVLIDALPALLQVHSDALCLIAGEGSARPELERQVARLGVSDRVRFLGHRSDVPELMRLADLFVLPSRGEGMPTVLLEAIASGCRVVTTDVGAVREVTRGGALATIVPPGRPDMLAAACVQVLERRNDRASVGGAATEDIRQRFSPARAAEETAAVYSIALAERGRDALRPNLPRSSNRPLDDNP